MINAFFFQFIVVNICTANLYLYIAKKGVHCMCVLEHRHGHLNETKTINSRKVYLARKQLPHRMSQFQTIARNIYTISVRGCHTSDFLSVFSRQNEGVQMNCRRMHDQQTLTNASEFVTLFGFAFSVTLFFVYYLIRFFVDFRCDISIE